MDTTFHSPGHMNHWAILVCALGIWMLGAIWYSPALFAKPWMAALGIVPTPGGQKNGLALGMISSLLGDLALCLILLHFVLWSGASHFAEGAFIGFLCWLGIFAATQVPQAIYERRPANLFLINGGYWLVSMLAAGGILAVWR